jgi:protein MpaA
MDQKAKIPDQKLATEVLGRSQLGQDIVLHRRLAHGQSVTRRCLVVGGVHGDEPEGYSLVEALLQSALERTLPVGLELLFVPRLNPDGCAMNQRGNGRRVDLNRNLPTRDWSSKVATPRYHPGPFAGSEVENQILMKLIDREKPNGIVSAHSWNPMINFNGPSREWAQRYGELTGYVVSDDIGYPTPGSLGTWAGWERKIPTITLEIERGLPIQNMLSLHVPAFWGALEFWAKGSQE